MVKVPVVKCGSKKESDNMMEETVQDRAVR